MPEVFVQSFSHLKDKPRADEALRRLQKLASLVKPIMRKHSWILPELAEMFPDNPSLLGLNINKGQKILIRLRPAFDPEAFYPEEELLGTLLHELTHNVHGPHDDAFYKYLAGLEDELDALRRSGYAGEGFHGSGQRVGSGSSHNLPPHLARLKALEAAEKRQRLGRLSGTNRLGGSSNHNLTPQQLAAQVGAEVRVETIDNGKQQAAIRRARDQATCGSSDVAQKEADKAAKQSIKTQVIDLMSDSDSDSDIVVSATTSTKPGSSDIGAQKGKMASNQTLSKPASIVSSPSARKPSADRSATLNHPEPTPWTCQICTLINDTFALQCAVCLARPPRDPASGWVCLDCGTGNDIQFWMCKVCGTIKSES